MQASERGGLAQLARASGSYPAGRWFKSDIRYHSRLVGQAVKTRPFHGCNSGSIPLRVTRTTPPLKGWCFSFWRLVAHRTARRDSDQRDEKVSRGSHTPPADRQARLSGAGCGYIRHRRNSAFPRHSS